MYTATAKKTFNVLLKLKIICGDYEFYSLGTHQVKEGELCEVEIEERDQETEPQPDSWELRQWMDSYAASFYDGGCYQDGEYFFFHSGGVAVCVQDYHILTDQEYRHIKKYV